MAAHTVSMVASTVSPYTLSLSDDEGHNSSSEQGDANFTTNVSGGDTIQWLLGTNSNIRSITAITKESGTTLFESGQEPTSDNSWTGKIAMGLASGSEESYSIGYTTSSGVACVQDPKMKMR